MKVSAETWTYGSVNLYCDFGACSCSCSVSWIPNCNALRSCATNKESRKERGQSELHYGVIGRGEIIWCWARRRLVALINEMTLVIWLHLADGIRALLSKPRNFLDQIKLRLRYVAIKIERGGVE